MTITSDAMIVSVLGLAQGYVAIPFYIFLVPPILESGAFANKRFKAVSAFFVFLALLSAYFIVGGLFVTAVPESQNYSRPAYYKIWFASQFVGMLLWAVLRGAEKRRN